jgi:hypothetical protein
MATATIAEAPPAEVDSASAVITADIHDSLILGVLALRTIDRPEPGQLQHFIETQDAILRALHGPSWHLLPEVIEAFETWHYPDPCLHHIQAVAA